MEEPGLEEDNRNAVDHEARSGVREARACLVEGSGAPWSSQEVLGYPPPATIPRHHGARACRTRTSAAREDRVLLKPCLPAVRNLFQAAGGARGEREVGRVSAGARTS